MYTYFMLKCVFYTLGAYVMLGQIEGVGSAKDMSVVRKTAYGKVVGNQTDLAQVFYGIPYASPPKRWTDPVDPLPWKGRYEARFPKPTCYQGGSCSGESSVECGPIISEDCLYLNIFAPPDTRKKSKKAVYFFIHGGGFDWGSGAAPVFNGKMVANKGDVIVVTINFRLGAFGFLVTGNSTDDITGNYGIKDQRQALKWVYENIRRFGGDKRKITIAGQSAGAYSTAIHFTSGNVDTFFKRAVIQSSPFTIPLKPLHVAEGQGFIFAHEAGCVKKRIEIDTKCLKALTPDRVVDIQHNSNVIQFRDTFLSNFMPWIPHIDGVEIKSGLVEGFLNTTIPTKELILGTVRDEGLPYIMMAFDIPINAFLMEITVELFVGNVPDDLVSLYPVANVSDIREELSLITTDYIFACPSRLIARELANLMPVYTYMFDQPAGFPDFLRERGLSYCIGRVCNSADVPYFFQTATKYPYVFDEEQMTFSDKVVNYLANFVKYGNPNRKLVNGTKWLQYKTRGKTSESTIVMKAEEMSHVQDYRGKFCDMWDTTGY